MATAPMMITPAGFAAIQGGIFTPLAGSTLGAAPIAVDSFTMASTPVTNALWGALAQSLGQDRFVLLDHNWQTGVTNLVRRGATVEAAIAGPLGVPKGIDFDRGDIAIFGSQILIKMVDNPSAQYDAEGRVFSRINQPVVGITYFHAKTWCLLKSLEDGDRWHYDLPTDVQHEYVASDRGTKEYGTETGTLCDADGRKLAHIDEYRNDRGSTVDVDDSRYAQQLPFGVQTTGNVWRWIQMNPAFRQADSFLAGPFGLRGGSWGSVTDYGRAACRDNCHDRPDERNNRVGFSPVAVRQDS